MSLSLLSKSAWLYSKLAAVVSYKYISHSRRFSDVVRPDTDLQFGMEKWRNKVAVVTGASSGIGRAVSLMLAQSGMRVVGVARRQERLEELKQNMIQVGVKQNDFFGVVGDVTNEGDVIAIPSKVMEQMNAGIDVLVNGAGLARKDSDLFDGKKESWVEMVNTNIIGLSVVTREILKHMEARKSWGHIVNICGESGHIILPGLEFYSASKHAVAALTKGLQLQARRRGIPLRVSQVSPGRVETEFRQVFEFGNEGLAKEFYKRKERLQPEDVAKAVVYALSVPTEIEVQDVIFNPKPQQQD